MGLPDSIAQKALDKAATIRNDMVTAAAPNVPFYDVIHAADDAAVDLYVGQGGNTVDGNLSAGMSFSPIFGPMLQGLQNYLVSIPSTLDAWLTSRRWRVPRVLRDLLNEQGIPCSRLNVFSEEVTLGTHVQGGSFTAGSDLDANAGACMAHLKVGAGKGAAAWTPVNTVVHEGPTASLVASATAGASTITVDDESEFPVAGLPGVTFLILVGSECMEVTDTDAGGAPAVWDVTRAQKGTVAAVHSISDVVYFVSDENGAVIPGSCTAATYWPVKRVPVTTLALSGQAVVAATGVGGTAAFAVDGNYCIVRDRTCPQKLTSDCTAADQAVVEDASVFHPGDYIIIDDNNSAAELATVRDMDVSINTVYFDEAVAGTFTTGQSAILSLAWTTINEGGAFAAGDVTLTVAAAAMLPPVEQCPYYVMIEDEILIVTNIAGDNLTVTRGALSTIAVDHADGLPVIVCPASWAVEAPRFNAATEGGNQEWGVVATAAANQVTLSANLEHTYGLAGYIEPLIRDVVLIADGAGGNAGDIAYAVSSPDREITRAK